MSSLSLQELRQSELGAIRKEAAVRIGLVYPSPYNAAMSSLGYQQVYRLLNALPDIAADRIMAPAEVREGAAPSKARGSKAGKHDERRERQAWVSLERGLPISAYPMLAFSVAYELEIAGLVAALLAAGIPPLRRDRTDAHPLVIAGGPLTFSNPAPLAALCDAIVLGEAEEALAPLCTAAIASRFCRTDFLDRLKGLAGMYLPDVHGEHVPPIAAASDAHLPARSQIITPHAELANMFLTEAGRGCSRGCTYCVMRRSTNGGMRIVDPATILAGIPAAAKRVGLVGAAVTDHPHIAEVVRGIVEAGRQVGISSLRADKLDDELVGLLARGGYRTLTVAADGASERMRRVVERSTKEQHLLNSARLAHQHKLKTVKIYMMVGVPEETDDDIAELVRFSAELAKAHGQIAYGIAPFVAKRNTPLDGSPFAGIELVDHRLTLLRDGLRQNGLARRVEVRSTSARWAWVEYMLAQAESVGGEAVITAHRDGGSFRAYERAFAAHGVVPTGPRARVPSSAEVIAARRQGRLPVLSST